MKIEILKELLKGSKPYSTNHQFAPILEEMFWNGEVSFRGNLVEITDLGRKHYAELTIQ
jgi:hypothetical protein